MLYWILNILYEYLWVTAIYIAVYKGGHAFMRDHAKILKVAFDVDIRYFSYNSETASKEKHEMMHTLASTVTFLILAINPVVHSMIFIWFRFMDITQLNRLVIYLAYLRLARVVNIMGNTPYVTRKLTQGDYFMIFQLLYTNLYFWNPAMVIPAAFHLLDEMWDLRMILVEIYNVHRALLGSDDWFSNWVLNKNALIAANRKTLRVLRVGTLFSFILLSIFYSDLNTMTEISFHFAAAGRVAFLYTEKDPERLE